MYRIKAPEQALLDRHFSRYADELSRLMTELANGSTTIPVTIGRTKKIPILLKVENGSPTHTFLTKYAQKAHLRQLLCGDWDTLLSIVDEVCNMIQNLEWQQSMTKDGFEKGKYVVNGQNAQGQFQIDHFHDILYWLFVEQMYNGANTSVPFQKTTFVGERGLEVCPYCGRQRVNMASVPDRPDSKPPIDHFLPKSKYPFLAMSFFNLIPCCTVCNEFANKGDFDPLEFDLAAGKYFHRLQNPHVFDDNTVKFGYAYNGKGIMNDKNFKVKATAANSHFEEGYFSILKLRAFYEKETLKVKDMYKGFTTATDSMKEFLKKLGVGEPFLANLEQMTLGYRLNDDEASRKEFYKFKKEVFEQLMFEYGFQ